MIIENNKIIASEGYVLTQSKDVDIQNRIFASEISLGKLDNSDNWKEITQEEADEIIEQINNLHYE